MFKAEVKMNIKGCYYLCLKEVRRFLVVWKQTILTPAISSLIFLFIFTIVMGATRNAHLPLGVSFLSFLVPGLIMMQSTQSAFANSSSSIVMSKVFGTINDVFAAPLSNQEIACAYIVSSVIRGILTALVIMLIGWLYSLFMHNMSLEFKHFFWGLYFLIVSSFIMGGFGMICGLWAFNFDRVSAITNMIIMPLTFLSGTFYSIHSLPVAVQKFSLYNPVFHMIDGLRYSFIGIADYNIKIGALYLLVLAIIMYVTCVYLLRIGYKTKA